MVGAPREARLAAALVIFGGCGRLAFDPFADRDAGVDALACADIVCLDPAFDSDGITVVDVGGVDNIDFVYRALAIEPDDRIVLGGQGGAPGNSDLVAVRLTEEGALDPTFATAGIATIDAGAPAERTIAITRASDGRLLLAGASSSAGIVVRLTSDGVLDPTFDGDGILVDDVNATGPVAFNGLTIDVAGRIVIGGQAFSSGNYNWIVLRLLTDGSPDTSLSGSGLVSVDNGNRDQFGTLGAVTDAGILVVGQTFTATDFDGALLRLRDNGFPDGSFGTNGIASTDLGDSERFFAAALEADGSIVAGGQARATDDDLLVARFTAAGVRDDTFGAGGVVRIDRSADENVRGLVILPDGRIVAAGLRDAGGTTISVLAILDRSGAVLDVRDVDLGPGDDAIQDLELDHHGRIVALGSVDDASDPANTDFVIARFIVP